MKFFLLFFLSLSVLLGISIDIADTEVLNGKTLFLKFDARKSLEYEDIRIGKKSYKIFKNPIDDRSYYALVPMDYREKAGEREAELFYVQEGEQKSKKITLHVKSASYEKETLKVDNSKVVLSEEDKKRARKEYEDAMKIYGAIRDEALFSSAFVLPMQSKITSDFGKARVYNDTLKGYHGGVDFRADVGTPIMACNDGEVVLADDRFYSGGSLVIDHGHGIYSCYFHMSAFNVTKGSKIAKGDIIGLSGKSGRVTGPHLHFGIRVGSLQVDPLQFIDIMNNKLLKGVK